MISIGTIGLIKGITTFKPEKGARLATYAARCVENEILMYFRSQKKTGQDVSLSDYIETGTDGAALSLMEVVSDDEDLLETVSRRESIVRLIAAVDAVLTEQERQVICLRYGLGGIPAKRQREVANLTGISRSYVSRHAYCKRCPGSRIAPWASAIKLQSCHSSRCNDDLYLPTSLACKPNDRPPGIM